jgi:hypothetical protein
VPEVAWLLVGATLGFFVKEGLGRGVRSLDRRRATRDPLLVHVESDPSIIWAGMPPWIGAAFLVPPEADLTSPPSDCRDWHAWAHARGAVDADESHHRVTLIARRDVLVVVDGLRVRVHRREQSPGWRSIICGVGGAGVSPRHARIELSGFDPPMTYWIDEDGDQIAPPRFSLSATEVEMLHISANVGDEWVEWTIELLVLVDGQRKVIEISDGGRPFVIAGAAAATGHHMWVSGGSSWDPPLGN